MPYSDVQTLLLNRQSCGRLGEPAPLNENLEYLFQAAFRAPDHAGLKPWQYLIYRSEESLGALGDHFALATQKADPDANEQQIERARSLPKRAPMVIVAVAKIKDHPKVPEVEQILSVGCGVHSMLLALQDMGFAGYWRTGDLAYNPYLLSALELAESDRIVGFLYVGTPLIDKKKLNQQTDLSESVVFR